MSPPPRRLPPAPRTLFGRGNALALLAEAVAPASVTAVVGPPGVGKSALVAAWIGGAALWVDLAHATNAADLWTALGRELGVALAGADGACAQVAAAIIGAGLATVVLDAAEHLDATAWDEVAHLEQALPGVTWVVTSVVLPAARVRVLELGPLATDDAVALLVARAHERALDARVDPGEPVWANLAARLGGLPLALELAAGRFGVLSPAQLLERLDRPRLLAGGRHGTLDGALRYAWDLLGAEDRAALAACAVFRGGFDLPAAEAVLGDDALDRLTALRERSALSWRDGRFSMYDGLRRLAEAEGGDALRDAELRHSAWYAAQSEALRRAANGPEAFHAGAALLTEMPNLAAAWERAHRSDPRAAAGLALGILASVRVHGPHWGADFLGDPSPLARAVGGPAGVELLTEWACFRRLRGRLDEAGAAAEEAVALAEGLGHAESLSYALAELGMFHHRRGDRVSARASMARSVDLAPDAFRRGVGLIRISHYDVASGDLRAATEHTEAALLALREAGSVRSAATAVANLASCGRCSAGTTRRRRCSTRACRC